MSLYIKIEEENYDKHFLEQDFDINDFQGFLFEKCIFEKCILTDCDFAKSRFVDCTFVGCTLNNIKTGSASLPRVIFRNSQLVGFNFSLIKDTIIDWTFEECQLVLCDFQNLKIPKTSFAKSTLRDCDFYNTDLTKANFEGTDLSGSTFEQTKLINASFSNARNYLINPSYNQIKGGHFSMPEVLRLLDCFDIKIE